MSKLDERIESIYNVKNFLEKDKFLPIYFLFGEEEYTINSALELIRNKLSEFVLSEFDNEVFDFSKDANINSIIDLAYSFPLGGGKKIIVVKDFDSKSDSKEFLDYIENPSEFTFLVITQKGKKIDSREKIYKLLAEKGYLFQAKAMNRKELVNWVISTAQKNKMKISQANAELLIDIVGSDKANLNMNLIKFSNSNLSNGEITTEVIENLGSSVKEFTGLNLLNAIINKNKPEALEIADSLFDKSDDRMILSLLSLLTTFVTTLAKILELEKLKLNSFEAAKQAGVSLYFYENCSKANYLKDYLKLKNAIEALLEAEIAVKSTSIDSKTIMMTLIAKIIP